MAVSKQPASFVKVPMREKLLVAGLMILEIPFAIFFIPLATVLVLTGILAPLGMLSFALGTKPFSLALRIKNASKTDEA